MYSLRTRPFWLAFDQPHFPRGFALGRWLALLILVSTALLGQERASAAGCSSLLAGHGEHGSAMDDGSGESSRSAIPFLSIDLSHPTPPPCNGPNCGRDPHSPPPITLSELPTIKIFACPLGYASVLAGLESGPGVADALQAELAGYPLRIDRPPVL